MSDKCVLKVYKVQKRKDRGKGVVRIDTDALEKIYAIQRQTGLSVKHIASELIRFASDRVEVMEI